MNRMHGPAPVVPTQWHAAPLPGLAWAATLLLFCSVVFVPGSAAEPPSSPDSLANRYLVVVETSSAMERRAPAVVHQLQRLLASGLKGEMRDGDTIGLWTFNERLSAAGLSVQHWSAAQKDAVTARMLKYLTSQPLEKSARFSSVAAGLSHVLKISEYLTVVLFCTGTENFTGTPFDDQINSYFKEWRSQQQKENQPFIVILRAKGGTFTAARVTSSPWPVEVPAFPTELKLAREEAARLASAAAAKASPPTAPAPVKMGAPLIISGKKAKPEEAPAKAAPVSPVAPPPLPGSTPEPAPLAVASTPPVIEPREPVAATVIAAPERRAPGPEPKPVSRATEPLPEDESPRTKTAPANLAPPGESAAVPPVNSDPVDPATEGPGQVATATPVSPRGGIVLLLAIGGLLLGMAAIAAFILVRRSRRAQPVSLITESLDRARNP